MDKVYAGSRNLARRERQLRVNKLVIPRRELIHTQPRS